MDKGWWLDSCREPSLEHGRRARERQAQLTKPQGALGRMETLAIELAALQATDQPRAGRVPVLLFAGDHGVVAQGVSAYPAEVTVQMLANFASGGAAISVLARELGLPLHLRDVGTLANGPVAGAVVDKPCCGTRDLSVEPAMADDEVAHALGAGRRAVEEAGTGADLLMLGEMGIGNTTPASALSCALTGLPPEELVGAGTGLDEVRIQRKREVVERALALHRGAIDMAPLAGLEALRRVGGLEIAAMAGAMVAAAQRSTPVLVDGFIVSAAALAAVRINPGVRDWLLFSHCSAEHGHRQLLQQLEAVPLLALDLRLGEGSGAAVALPLLRLACALHNTMATFEQAAVAGAVPE